MFRKFYSNLPSRLRGWRPPQDSIGPKYNQSWRIRKKFQERVIRPSVSNLDMFADARKPMRSVTKVHAPEPNNIEANHGYQSFADF